jgi:hypothetical protein
VSDADVTTTDRNPMQRRVLAAMAAFVVFEVANGIRHWLVRTRRKSAYWWERVERHQDRRRHEATFVLLLSRLPGVRNRRG